MSRTITIAMLAALLFAVAVAPASAAEYGQWTRAASTTTCHDPVPFAHPRRWCVDPLCPYVDLGDRIVGPTFPAPCRQMAASTLVHHAPIST